MEKVILPITILCLILLSLQSCKLSSETQVDASETITSGNERYYQQDEVKAFEAGFFGTSVYEDVRTKPLFVRLDQQTDKIAAMRKDGREAWADKLEKKLEVRNRAVVSSLLKNYNLEKLFFYYEDEADKIFRDRKFNLVKKDIEKSAGVDAFSNGYVLIYRTTPELKESKRFILHYWDGDKVSRLKGGYSYKEYVSFLSPKVDFEKTMKKFSDIVWN